MAPGEESPLGLLLCTEGSDEWIELIQLDKADIKVAMYRTEHLALWQSEICKVGGITLF